MSRGRDQRRGGDAARLYARAAALLDRRLSTRKCLTPAEVTATVFSVLPPCPRRGFARWLRERGWLHDPVDPTVVRRVLDREVDPRWVPLLELAILGPPGQGRPAEARQREAAFQRLTAELMREAMDEKTLEVAANRALNSREAREDPVLAGMIRSFVAEQAAQLRAERQARETERNLALPAWQHAQPQTPRGAPGRDAILRDLNRLRHEFDEAVVHFDLPTAEHAARKIERMHQRYPDVVPVSAVGRCRVDLAKVRERQKVLREEIESLARCAVESAARGDHVRATQCLQRLSTIHATRPLLLPDDRFAQIRERILEASRRHEQREIARELLAREKAVIEEIRHLAAAIRRFHRVARSVPHDDPTYRQAEQAYREALRQIRSHDAEWLANLVLELDDLLEDLHDPTGRAQQHVDRFLRKVRKSLRQLHAELERATHRHRSRPGETQEA